ncbi:hypothetical protein FA15DRAFT_34798 [Coprinopsis marcescibilis]|uniref:C3H1-type domain-containing protein n=1 Tax=Coprinopsis marcescibilis TaxID=230819 RepID=A0A5C3LDU3_COPMA|nr:hypothetical protein FA15DRAFT_34798 [Coprinopsis marcescibilis]
MVSALWKACSDGDLDTVLALLNNASDVDIELKDHTGATPLIEAVKNGHVEVVKVLLSKGADTSNASSQGRPEHYTSDPVILDLLKSVPPQNLANNNEAFNDNGYGQTHASNDYSAPPPPPPGAYAYYPTINPSLPTMPDGGGYYPPLPPQPTENGSAPNGVGHLPPPDIARMIPCRYYPACRYGPQCMFAHPQFYPQPGATRLTPTPHYDMPPGHYFYPPPPPPPFQQPNGAPITPLSPPPPHSMHHGRSPSEIVSPSAGHFVNGAPPPAPYSQLSPGAYPPHMGQVPVPMSGLPPMHMQHPMQLPPGPQSPGAIYQNGPPIPHYPPPDVAGHYMPPPGSAVYTEIDPSGAPAGANGHADGYGPQGNPREVNGHRRGVGRRGSFAGKKPACLFFPAGRCKNGDDCRFPHVLESNPTPNHVQPFYPQRGGAPRPARNHHNQQNGGPGVGAIDQKMANLSIQNGGPRSSNGDLPKGEFNNRPRYQPGPKHHQGNGHPNGGKRTGPALRPQRVPSADDFPVLPGTVTPPRVNGVNGHSHSGPTAADILRAPAPQAARKTESEDGVTIVATPRGPSPDATRTSEGNVEPAKVDPAPQAPAVQVQVDQTPQPQAAQKLPVSFAAAAAASAAAAAVSASA